MSLGRVGNPHILQCPHRPLVAGRTEGIQAHVVSIPSWELFEHQSREYRDSVIPPEITARVSVE
ncbi:MAG: transketolase-like TK C-terminal-containing protein [Candidatus Entotheonellia bacterium]